MVGEAFADQGGHVVGATFVGREDLEADAIDTDEGAALGELADRRHVGLLVLVTDEDTTEIGAAVGEEVLLHVAVLGVLGVGDDRAPDLALGERGAGQAPRLGRGHLHAGGRLDRPGADPARPGDALHQLPHVELGDLLRIAGAPVERQPGREVLGVEAGGAHDAHPRPRRDLRVELGIAPELDGARVDERAEAGVEQLTHLVDRTLHGLGPVPRVPSGRAPRRSTRCGCARGRAYARGRRRRRDR